MQEKYKLETEEKEFFHKQALDAKRKNKLLKVAITRIQTDNDNMKDTQMETPALMLSSQLDSKRASADVEADDKTFLTGARVEEHVGKSADSDLLNVDNLANS